MRLVPPPPIACSSAQVFIKNEQFFGKGGFIQRRVSPDDELCRCLARAGLVTTNQLSMLPGPLPGDLRIKE